MSNNQQAPSSIRSRLAREFRNYTLISSYLFICFVVILLYETSLLPGGQATVLDHGLALGKALVVGKFILIGEALDAGNRLAAPTLLHRIVYRSLAMLIVLLVLKLLEELILGRIHGESTSAVIAAVFARPWVGLLAPVLIMLLILVPLVTTTELNRALGGQLGKLVFGRGSDGAQAGDIRD